MHSHSQFLTCGCLRVLQINFFLLEGAAGMSQPPPLPQPPVRTSLDFRKLFDQGKNNVRRIDRKTGRLLSEDPVGNWMLTRCLPSKDPVGNWILTRKDPSGHRMPTLSGRLAFLQNYQTKIGRKKFVALLKTTHLSKESGGKMLEIPTFWL